VRSRLEALLTGPGRHVDTSCLPWTRKQPGGRERTRTECPNRYLATLHLNSLQNGFARCICTLKDYSWSTIIDFLDIIHRPIIIKVGKVNNFNNIHCNELLDLITEKERGEMYGRHKAHKKCTRKFQSKDMKERENLGYRALVLMKGW
jgi:hypothetical protein